VVEEAAMRIVRCGAAVLLAGASVLVGSPVYGGGVTVPLLDAIVTPDVSTPGSPVTITPASPDDLCPAPGDTLEWTISGPADDLDGTTAVDGTGDWTVETPTPETVGTYDFDAVCVGPDGEGTTVFAEYTATFAVESELDPFQAFLDQSSGPPGDDIELGAIACFGDSGAALFMPPGAVPAFSPDLVDQGLQQYDVVDNQFGGVVPVAADTAPGPYQVVAWCLNEGELAADPVVLSYTVLAAGAVPVPPGGAVAVPAAPSFTG
jgi:hypothetical protein